MRGRVFRKRKEKKRHQRNDDAFSCSDLLPPPLISLSLSLSSSKRARELSSRSTLLETDSLFGALPEGALDLVVRGRRRNAERVERAIVVVLVAGVVERPSGLRAPRGPVPPRMGSKMERSRSSTRRAEHRSSFPPPLCSKTRATLVWKLLRFFALDDEKMNFFTFRFFVLQNILC